MGKGALLILCGSWGRRSACGWRDSEFKNVQNPKKKEKKVEKEPKGDYIKHSDTDLSEKKIQKE